SELNAIHDAAELLVKFEDGAGAGAVGFDQLLDARLAHADERELGCGEEGIGRYQEQDNEHPQQHVCNYGSLILTFQRDNRLRRSRNMEPGHGLLEVAGGTIGAGPGLACETDRFLFRWPAV